MDSPNTKFIETDLTVSANLPIGGISGVMLVTKRGPLGNVNEVITSWERFQRLYGGFINNNSDPAILLAKRALDGGSALRVSRLNHYTDIDDPTSYAAEFSVPALNQVFTLSIDLAAGHTVVYTSGTAVNQVFDTSSTITLQKLAVKIKAAFGNVYDAIVLTSKILVVVPRYANLSAVVSATGVGAPTVTATTQSAFKNAAANTLFTLAPRYPGADGDNIVMQVRAGSNGQTGYWDLVISHLLEPDLDKVYPNLIIPGSPTVANSHYLDSVIKDPNALITVTYSDLSAIVANPIIPVNVVLKLNAGDDGLTGLVAADQIGSAAGKTGFYAFDGVDDISQLALLNTVLTGVHQAGAAYAQARKDLQYFAHIVGDTEADLIAAKDALAIDSSYAFFTGGNINVVDPWDSAEKVIPELGDVLGLAAYSETNFGAWFSFSGMNRGLIQNSLGAANNFGARGNIVNLNLLANHQINVVINRDKRVVLWGSFTGQIGNSQLSLGNIRRLHIYIKKALGPVLERFIEEPCDIPMFKQAYVAGKAFMDQLIPKRAIFDYSWQGDQFADKPSDFKINDPADVSLGKYKVKLFVKDIASLQTFELNITLTPAGVSFEDALLLVQQ